MWRHFLLALSTKGLEYGGALLNYACLAAAVFGGAWADAGASPGGLAGRVSLASFYLLMLVYSFTQVGVCSLEGGYCMIGLNRGKKASGCACF